MPTISVRTGEHPTFDRVVFDMPRGAQYRLVQKGGSVTVTFSLAAKLKTQPLRLTRVHDIKITAGLNGGEPLAVVLSVNPEAKLKSFMSDASAVVDIYGPAWRAAAEEVQKPEKERTEQQAKSVEDAPAPIQAEASKPAESDVKQDVSPVAVSETSEAEAPLASKEAVSPPAVLEVPNKPVPTFSAEEEKLFQAAAQSPKPQAVLVFNPETTVGAAVFTRGGFVTLVFDRKLEDSAWRKTASSFIKLEKSDVSGHTVFRFAVPSGIVVRATREGTALSIFLAPEESGVGVSTEFVVQPDFALGARYVIPTAEPSEPIFFQDPVVGDHLIILPMREAEAFTAPRRLADFRVIPAAQGLVIKPFHEKVVTRVVPGGVEITSEGGLNLSPQQDTGLTKGSSGVSVPRFFDLATWRGRSGDGFTETRQKLLQTIINVPNNQKVLARMDLARFYFAHAMGEEAVALLRDLQSKLPELDRQPDFIGLRGASRLLTKDVAKGLEDLNAPALQDQPEITLWKAYGSAQLRDWVAAAERFKLAEPLLKIYPEPFRSRFWILAVESALAAGKDQDAAAWLAELGASSTDPTVQSAVLYLRGALQSKAGHIEQAEKNWKKAAQGRDRLYKIRAELALIDLGVATKSMTPRQAAERLEGLRFAWRGDDMEFDILRRLGGFYVEANHFRKGFDVLAQAIRLYPESPQAPLLRAQMTKLFKEFLLTPKGDDISPLEALSLYLDYRFLVPPGEEGNVVRRNLVDRLVSIDLLDPASQLLEDIVKNSPSVEDRVKATLKLAAVKLLDHKADAAMAALDHVQGDVAGLPEAVQKERLLLRARSLFEAGKYDDALSALPADAGEAGQALRADICLRAKRWVEAATALIDIVGPVKPGVALTDKQAGWLVNAAMALARAGDAEGLDKLSRDYGAAMGKTQKSNVFFVLTHPESGAEMKDIAAAQNELSGVDAFRSFLDSYRKSEGK